MKRKITLVLTITLTTILFTACSGDNKDTEASKDVKEVAVVTEVKTEPEKETAENVNKGTVRGWDALEEWTIGPEGDIVPLSGQYENGVPEFTMQLPLKSNDYTITAIDYENGIRVNETENRLVIRVSDTAYLEARVSYWPMLVDTLEHDWAHYSENTVNGYTLDIDWVEDKEHPAMLDFTVKNNSKNCTVEVNIMLNDENGIINNVSDADKAAFIEWVNKNIEWLSGQCETFPENYTPVAPMTVLETETTVEETAMVIEETVTDTTNNAMNGWTDEQIAERQAFIDSYYRTYISNNGMTINLAFDEESSGETGTCILNNGDTEYSCNYEVIGEGTYSLTINGNEFAQLYNDEPDVFQFYSLSKEFDSMNGYYE